MQSTFAIFWPPDALSSSQRMTLERNLNFLFALLLRRLLDHTLHTHQASTVTSSILIIVMMEVVALG